MGSTKMVEEVKTHIIQIDLPKDRGVRRVSWSFEGEVPREGDRITAHLPGEEAETQVKTVETHQGAATPRLDMEE